MSMEKGILCIGSNYRKKENLALAREHLMELFPNIRFSTEQETLPVGIKNQAMFSNQIGFFFSHLKEEQIKVELKNIEKKAGRCLKDQEKGIIALDIDLLLFHHRILKPQDMKREYVIKGIKEIFKTETKETL